MRRPSLPKRRRRGGGGPGVAPAQGANPKPGRKLPALKLPPLKLPPLKRPPKLPPLKLLVPGAAAILLVVLLLGTCGTDDEQKVRETLSRFAHASREKDYQALCDDLLATSLVEQLRTADQPCEVVWRIGLSEVRNPTLAVQDVKIDGDEATAQVDSAAAGQRPLKTKILLVQEDGDWRISSLPDEQQPAAGP